MGGIAIPERLEGGAGIDITPEGLISATGGAIGGGFSFQSVPTVATTGPGLVTLMTVPVTVTTAGRLLITLNISCEVALTAPSALAQGADFGLLWDGAPIPAIAPSAFSQTAFMEFDPNLIGGSPDSFSNQIVLRDVVPASLATVGAHTLTVQFEGLAAQSAVLVFDGSGSLTIEGVS